MAKSEGKSVFITHTAEKLVMSLIQVELPRINKKKDRKMTDKLAKGVNRNITIEYHWPRFPVTRTQRCVKLIKRGPFLSRLWSGAFGRGAGLQALLNVACATVSGHSFEGKSDLHRQQPPF